MNEASFYSLVLHLVNLIYLLGIKSIPKYKFTLHFDLSVFDYTKAK